MYDNLYFVTCITLFYITQVSDPDWLIQTYFEITMAVYGNIQITLPDQFISQSTTYTKQSAGSLVSTTSLDVIIGKNTGSVTSGAQLQALINLAMGFSVTTFDDAQTSTIDITISDGLLPISSPRMQLKIVTSTTTPSGVNGTDTGGPSSGNGSFLELLVEEVC